MAFWNSGTALDCDKESLLAECESEAAKIDMLVTTIDELNAEIRELRSKTYIVTFNLKDGREAKSIAECIDIDQWINERLRVFRYNELVVVGDNPKVLIKIEELESVTYEEKGE